METNNSFSRLRELRGSGYEIVDGEPDIIGWSIRDTADRKLGVVHDLLFEPEQQKVRYIIAHLKDNDFDLDRRKVLIPIGVAQLHENNDNVILNAVQPWQIRALPTYDKRMGDQDEQDIYTIFSTTDSTLTNPASPVQQNIYDHKNYNYDNLFQQRRKDQPKANESKAAFLIRQRHENNYIRTFSKIVATREEQLSKQKMACRFYTFYTSIGYNYQNVAVNGLFPLQIPEYLIYSTNPVICLMMLKSTM